MNKEQILSTVVFAVAMLFVVGAYAKHLGPSFRVNETDYVAVGIMEIHDDGKTLYVPVFKRK